MPDRPAHGAAERRRHQPVVLGPVSEVVKRLGVASVAREQFVATLACQHDLHVVRRQPRNEIQRHARRVCQRLVLVPYQGRESLEEVIGTHHHLVVVGAIGVGDGTCVGELVRLPLGERDGESLDRVSDQPTHDRCDRGRVDPTREKHPQGNIRHQPHPHGLREALTEFRNEILVPPILAFRTGVGEVPVPSNLHRAASPAQCVAGEQTSHAHEQRIGARGSMIGEVIRQHLVIQPRRGCPHREQRLDLGRKVEGPVLRVHVVQRLHPQAIAGEKQLLPTTVPDGEREHPPQLVDRPRAILLVEAEESLGITPGAVAMTTSLQGDPEVLMVVDLTVVHDVE